MKQLLLIGLAMLIAGCTASGGAATPLPASSEIEAFETESSGEAALDSTVDRPSSASTSTATLIPETGDHLELLSDLLFARPTPAEAEAILDQIATSGDTGYVAGLIDLLRYQRGASEEIGSVLNRLTDQELPPDWFVWVEWAGQHPEIESFPDYPAWKSRIFAAIDPRFRRFVYPEMPVDPDSRVEEIVWGGVGVDGIPALDNPTMIDPAEADYLVPEERVFGVTINGDSRAYPARFLDWHEMFNDVVGGEPVSLAY